ncbi:glycyl-tRNA synthetase beta chain [Desulfitispora alkaliphila]|uniref:glycine--tRNA ligase subunit beta n=1 Tax=Desulfitispora alkaliphila TaxID=622674 RepID=UPI003D1D0B50
MTKDLLFEIGTEEIPAGFMKRALSDLGKIAQEKLQEARVDFEQIKTYGTPRRLTLIVENLAEKQLDMEEEVKGPSVKVAFDQTEEPTKACLGFAKGQGVSPGDLIKKEVKGVEYVYAIKREAGKDTATILPELLPDIIKSMSFPKTMRWGDSEFRFVRPIHWIVSLYGTEFVPFEIAGIKSDRLTRGHRFLSKGEIEISEPSLYFKALEDAWVIVDQERRRSIIEEQINQLAKQQGGKVSKDSQLLEEITHLVEYPTALCGNFEESYLELPKEALITSMKEHQRYYPVVDETGNLLNKFITVRNGDSNYLEVVQRGNEKVLEARLADARFFYTEDLKTPLEQQVKKLENIVFHEEIGTVAEKVKRMIDMTDYLAKHIKATDQTKEEANRVATIAKGDLVSHMVYEFPELQGVMGAYYAKAHGESGEVSRGIREHYLPRYAGDDLPQTESGWIVSFADKLDTIVDCFGIGIQPTGSQDPYALRRQALAIISLVLNKRVKLSLEQLLADAYDRLAQDIEPKVAKDQLVKTVVEFFKQRMKGYLNEAGHRYDVVEAVLGTDSSDFVQIDSWAKALSEFRVNEQFQALLTGFNRVANLAKKGDSVKVSPDLLEESAEKELYDKFSHAKNKIDQLIKQEQLVDALVEIAKLQPAIDKFFEEIMVMVDDEALKNNRLALLKSIESYVYKYVDLTKVVAK